MMSATAVFRLVVVDDHALFRAGLINLLSEMPEFNVIGSAENGEEALAVIANLKPDLVLLDINMPVMDGVETVKALKQTFHGRIVMLTISKNQRDLLGAIQAGADGYLLKNAEPEDLRNSLLLIMDDKSVLSPEVTGDVMNAVRQNLRAIIPDNPLTSREEEILDCLAQGMTTKKIAKALVISENTVKTHVRNVLEKLGAANRTEAVSVAAKKGLIKGR